MRLLLALVVAGMLMLKSASEFPVSASIINGNFSGTIFRGSDTDGVFGIFGDLVGQQVLGTFTVDTDLLVANPNCSLSFREFCGSGVGGVQFTLTINGNTIEFNGNHPDAFFRDVDRYPVTYEGDTNPPIDFVYLVTLHDPPEDTLGAQRQIQLSVFSYSIDFVHENLLDLNFSPFAPMNDSFGSVVYFGKGANDFFFNIESISAFTVVTELPPGELDVLEPSTLTVFTTALFLLLTFAFLRRRPAQMRAATISSHCP